jgi:hypothetical protein
VRATASNDAQGPTITEYNPIIGASNVDKDAVITLTFAEFVQRGDGTVSLSPSSYTWPNATLSEESNEPINIPISDPAQIILRGRLVTIDPFASFLTGGEEYKVTFSSGGVKDALGNDFAGIYGDSYTFRTQDIIPPSIAVYEPAPGSHGIGFPEDGDPIILTFNELVQAGNPDGGSLVATIGSTVQPLTLRSISGLNVTFDPLARLTPGLTYTVEISANTIQDLAGNAFAGILDNSYQLAVASPNTHSLTCTLGLACTLAVGGSGMQTHNRIRWIVGDCGTATCTDASPAPRPFRPESDGNTYNFGILTDTTPGQFTMCWASLGQSRVIVEGSEVLDCLEYYFTIGTLTLHGPSSVSAVDAGTSSAPSAGRSFSVVVLGVGLDTANRISIVDYNVMCGLPLASSSTSALVAGSTATAGSLVSTTSLTWSGLQLQSPGIYRVCWCSGAVYETYCNTDTEFNVDAGTLNLHGPYAVQDFVTTPSSYSCGFEDLTDDGCRLWDQLNKSDNLEWLHGTGATPSASTGPSAAKSGSYYMYLEASASDVTEGHQAFLSASLTLGTGASMSFWYHMYGSGIGTLTVQLQFSPDTSWTTLWTRNGSQGDAWLNVILDLAVYAGPERTLRFIAERGSDGTGDIAIDDVTLSPGTVIGGGWIGSNGSAVIVCESSACGMTWSASHGMFIVDKSGYSGGESEIIDITLQEVWDHASQQAVEVPALIQWQKAEISTGDYLDFLGTFRISRSRQQLSSGPGSSGTHLPSAIVLPSGSRQILWSSDDYGTDEGWRFTVLPMGNLNPSAGASFGLQVLGEGLTLNDRISIVESHIACGGLGSGTTTSRLSGSAVSSSKIGAANALETSSNGLTVLQWAGLQMSDSLGVLVVGTYRVCWCAVLATACDTDGEFNAEAGTFAVNGPTAIQDGELGGYLLAWVGKAFSLQIAGQGLVLGDRISIDVLGSAECGSLNAQLTTSQLSSGSVAGQGIAGTSGFASTSLRWTGLAIDASGTYRVCWCPTKEWLPTDCDSGDEFSINLARSRSKVLGKQTHLQVAMVLAEAEHLMLEEELVVWTNFFHHRRFL